MHPGLVKWLLAQAVSIAVAANTVAAADSTAMPDEAVWQAAARYEATQNTEPLRAIDQAVIAAHASMAARQALAARLAALAASPQATLAARQFACLKLRDVGTAAEVPQLTALLAQNETDEMARWALEAIDGDEASRALRQALGKAEGKQQLGLIHSLAARRDAAAVAPLIALAKTGNAPNAAADAAIRALGHIGGREAREFLFRQAQAIRVPTPPAMVAALLESSAPATRDSMPGGPTATEIDAFLSQAGQDIAARRAALERLFAGYGEGEAGSQVIEWLLGDDAVRRTVAAAHLAVAPSAAIERLLSSPGSVPVGAAALLVEELARRQSKSVLPLALRMIESGDEAQQQLGIRCLGLTADAAAVPLLVDALSGESAVSQAAQEALAQLPRKAVNGALVESLSQRADSRAAAIAVLKRIRSYEAIDPLVVLAAEPDPATYLLALDGLAGIADPDRTDLSRLLKLVAAVPRGSHRDEVERTIVLVSDKSPPKVDRAAAVIETLQRLKAVDRPEYLPLLGRLGGDKARAMISAAIAGGDAAARDAAIRGLCNWPDASVADELLGIASTAASGEHRRWALRAYIRVVTLKSNRPMPRTIAMLDGAMQRAEHADDRRLVLERVAALRSMAALAWLAPYLDHAELAEPAAAAIVELARDRGLRNPNQEAFNPLLDRIARTAKDATVRSRAREYRAGL